MSEDKKMVDRRSYGVLEMFQTVSCINRSLINRVASLKYISESDPTSRALKSIDFVAKGIEVDIDLLKQTMEIMFTNMQGLMNTRKDDEQ